MVSDVDCLLRNMRKCDYITPTGADEVLVPAKMWSWKKMVKMLPLTSYHTFTLAYVQYYVQ